MQMYNSASLELEITQMRERKSKAELMPGRSHYFLLCLLDPGFLNVLVHDFDDISQLADSSLLLVRKLSRRLKKTLYEIWPTP